MNLHDRAQHHLKRFHDLTKEMKYQTTKGETYSVADTLNGVVKGLKEHVERHKVFINEQNLREQEAAQDGIQSAEERS